LPDGGQGAREVAETRGYLGGVAELEPDPEALNAAGKASSVAAAFVWSGKIEFRIGEVTREADRVVVRAVAEGSPGRLVLLREKGRLKGPGRRPLALPIRGRLVAFAA
jgi:hypothetical protein